MAIARNQIRWNGWGWTSHRDPLSESEVVWHWLENELGMPALLATPARPLEDVTLPAQKLTPAQIADFAAILGAAQVTEDIYERASHAGGRSYLDLIALRAGDLSGAPDAVLYPRSADEVLAILALAAREKIAVIPFGGGTSLSGGVRSGPGSVTVDLSAMDRVLEIDVVARMAVAEAGVIGPSLAKALAAKGMALDSWPEDFEFSSLGGRIAMGCADDWLAGLQLVTPQGILDTDAQKAGPGLRQILHGSEGIFGIVTRARIKIRPVIAPLERAFLFGDFAAAITTLQQAVQLRLPYLTLQLSDESETRFQRRLAALREPRGLLRRLQDLWMPGPESGSALLVAAFPDKPSFRAFENLAKKLGGSALGEGAAQDERKNRVQALYWRDAMLDRGLGVDRLETRTDWSSIAPLRAAIRAALDTAMRDNSPFPGAHGLVLTQLQKPDAAGATLCFTFVFPRHLENEFVQGKAIRHAAIEAMGAHGGRVRPHYGVDEVLATEKDTLSVGVLRGVKAALDPAGIMNPGKLLPPI